MARDPARWSRRPRAPAASLTRHHFARPERMDPGDTAHMIVGVANCTVLPGAVRLGQGNTAASAGWIKFSARSSSCFL